MPSLGERSPDPQPLCLRVNTAARLAGISRSGVYRLIREGELPCRKVAGVRLIQRADLLRVLGIDNS